MKAGWNQADQAKSSHLYTQKPQLTSIKPPGKILYIWDKPARADKQRNMETDNQEARYIEKYQEPGKAAQKAKKTKNQPPDN